MAKTEGKVAPQKSSKPRKASNPKPDAPKKLHLSTEYVADSDDEDATSEDRSVKKVTTAAVPEKAKSKNNGKAKAVKAPPAPQQPPPDTESSSEDEDIAPPRANVVQTLAQDSTKTNGVKRKAEEQSSSDEESEEESEEESDEPAAKKTRTDGAVATEESAKESSEESEDEGDAPEVASAPAPPKPKERSAPTRPDATQPIPAPPFEAPTGYVAVDVSGAGARTDFSAASLAGKQIWHIAAPSDVPLSSITQVAMDAIQSSRPVLTHKGVEYALHQDATGELEAVLLPGKTGYEAAEQRVEMTLHLQQHITLPNLSARQASQATGSAAAGDIAQASVRGVRPQPKGLRMRYKPSGFGPGKPGMIGSGSDSNDEDDRATGSASFQFPRALGAHGTSKYQTEEGGGIAPEAHEPTGKPKKKRKEKLKDLTAATGEALAGAEVLHQAGITTTSAAMTPAKKVAMPEVAEQPDVLMADGADSEKISKEEKARRKEEKRKKKEAKTKARETAA